jgi:UPF0755 protein
VTFPQEPNAAGRRPDQGDGSLDIVEPGAGPGEDELDDVSGWDEDVQVRPARTRVVRIVLSLVFLGVIGVVLVLGVYRWFVHQLDPPGEPGEAVTVIVPPGSTTSDIGRIFEEEGIVPNSMFFRYYAQWKGEGNFQAGEYSVALNSSAAEAIEVLDQGPIPPVVKRFTVPEGLWVTEVLDSLSQQTGVPRADLEAALGSGQVPARYLPAGIATYEGLLFPDTYEVEDDATAVEILNRMAEEFARVTGELGYGAAEQRLDRSAYEVVIVASLVEAEARTDADRPKIARVIYNRLLRGEPLGVDATYIYAKGQRGAPITQSDINSDSPFNLRRNAGLPPHPIALPGRASLEAAISPEEGPWLWYVLADAEGNHFFTDNYDEFLRQRDASREAGLL